MMCIAFRFEKLRKSKTDNKLIKSPILSYTIQSYKLQYIHTHVFLDFMKTTNWPVSFYDLFIDEK